MSEALDTLHWQELKKRMEAAGLPWVSKVDAIEKLGKIEATTPEPDPAATQGNAPAAKEKPAAKAPAGFDRSKPYGMISGELEGVPGARYLQSRVYFNSAGEPVGKA